MKLFPQGLIVLMFAFVNIIAPNDKSMAAAKALNLVNSPRVYYTVDKSQPNWVMKSGGGTYTVQLHAGREIYPMTVLALSPARSITIQPGQWVSIDLNNGYGMGYSQDGDHR